MNQPAVRAPSPKSSVFDDALLQQLKAAAAQGTEQARATAPSSAVEMSQQIAQDFVANPVRRATPAIRQPAASGGGPTAGPADSTALTPPGSVNARDAASSMLFGFFSPIGGMLSERGLIGRLGVLSPEAAGAEQAQRVEQAKAAQAAQSAAATARQQLRNMTDEQAASMGLPVAPGVLDAETVRLLDEQGERREAFDAARAQEAEATTQAARDTAPTATWWLDAARNTYKGVTGMGLQAARGIVIPLEMLARSDKSEVREWIDTLDATIEKMVPGDKARSKDFLTKLSAGGGSMIGFMIGGMVATSVGMPVTAGTLIMGALTGGAEQYIDAERFNASGVQKLLSYFFGMGVGATEAIPINNMLFRMENATGGIVSRMLQSTAAQYMEEFIQELGDAVGSDVIAMALYDENREIDWGGAFEIAAVGGILGGVMGSAAATVGALQEVAAGRAVEPEQAAVVEAERVAAVDEFLTRTQEVFDQRMRTMAEAVAVEETLAPVETLAMEGVAPGTAQAVAVDVVPPVAPEAVAAALVEQAQAAPRPPTQLADDFVVALERPPLFEQNTVESTGGRVPAPDASGTIVLRHYAPEVRETLDPKFQGTGPLVGDERRSRPDRPQAVYYGVQTGPDFVQPAASVSDYAKLTPAEKKAARALQDAGVSEGMIRGALEARYRAERETSGYQREGGLGVFEHEVRVRPEELYNIRQDPLGLKSQLPTNLTSNERISILEGMVRDAGFRGAYYERSPLGQTVTLFDAATPDRVIDTRYGLPVDDIASLSDFANLTADAFNKGGWAVVTATQEALGPASAPDNVAANEKLRKRLARDGVQYIEVSGAYKGEPQGESFLIFAPEEYAKKLGKSLKQESILTRRGLEYSDGRITPVDPSQTVVGEGARGLDFYSQTPDGTAFSLGLDFDATTDAMAMAASNLTGDQWTAQEIGETIAGWVEAATNPESEHPLAPQIRELAESAGNIDADQLIQKLAGQLAAGEPGAAGEGAAAAERAGDGPWTVAALRQQDAQSAGGAEGGGPEFLASVASVDTSSENFRRWFGDSKVVDTNGEPLVVYHGTNADFREFDPAKAGGRDSGWYGRGFYFTPDQAQAEEYAAGYDEFEGDAPPPEIVIPAYVRVENPFRWQLNGGERMAATLRSFGGPFERRAVGDGGMLQRYEVDTFMRAVREAGHDGVIVERTQLLDDGSEVQMIEEIVAFEPAQIKSVDNVGTFDPSNPDIFAATASSRGRYRGEPTQTQEFRDWFGDSKVVDDQGEPLVVYHGTASDFRAFDPAKVGSAYGVDEQGFFFTSSESEARRWAGRARGNAEAKVLPVYLSMQRPWIIDAPVGRKPVEFFESGEGVFNVGQQAAVDYGVSSGYDGMIVRGEGETMFIAFTPEQIKSVDNVGTFDPSNPDIFAATASSRGRYRGEPTRPQAGIPGAPLAENSEIRLANIADNFVKLMNLTARQGRFTLKGANIMGQYSSRQDVVRLRTANDLSTLVHEGGHALQANASGPMKAFINGHIDELQKVAKALYGGDLSKADNATKTAEGFAEFFRVYVTNRAFAERKYSKLTTDFDAVLDTDPAMRDGLRAIGEQFAAWLQLPSAQLVRNMIESGKQVGRLNEEIAEIQSQGFGTWMHEVARNSLAAAVNQNAALDDLVAGVLNIAQESRGRALDLKRAEDPRALIRLATNSGNRGMVQVNDGVMGHRSTVPVTRSLRDALLRYHGLNGDQNLSAIDPERQTDFAAYLVALRGIDEYRRFAEGKIERPPVAATLGDLKTTVEEMNGKYGGDFAEAAQIVHEYGMGLWQKAFDAGLMSKQTYKDGLDRQFYAPLQRDMSDRSGGPAMSDIAGASAARPVRRFRGSDRNIIDPMDALMAKTFALERVIAENEVKKALAALADKAGKAGALVERIPAQQLLGTEYSVQEVARQLTKDDTLSQADAQDLMTMLEASIEEGNRIALFRSQQAQARGENVVFFWENGKLSALQIKDGDVGADVVNTLNAVGTENMPLFVNALAHTSTAFRSAITSWPDFILVNFIRDQVSAWLLTDVGYKPFVTGFGGVANEIRQKTWARQYNAAMGIMGGMNSAALHETRVKRDIGELRKRGYVVQAFSGKGVTGFIRGMARVAEVTETGTRLGLFQKAFEKAKADGLTDWEASIEASYLATDYMNFGLHGNRVMAHRRLIPFLNAQVQGLYKMMRTLGGDEVRQRRGLRFVLTSYFKDLNGLDLSRQERAALNTGRKAWAKMMSLGLIGALLTFLFEDDPDYQDTSEYLRATGWVIPLGGGEIAYIPKPFELAIVSNFVERAIEHASGDGEAKARFLRGAMMNLTPPTTPPAVGVLIEQLANHSFFAGREIVPDYMRALSPELQYNHYTSELAKQIGDVMGWSPMRVDHVLNGMGASAYRDLTQMYNTLDPNRPNSDPTDWPITRRFVRDARRGAVSAADFWKFASTVDGSLRRGEITYRRYLDTGRERAAEEFLDTLDEDHRSYALLNAHFKADAKRLNPMYRARQITSVISDFRRELPTELGLEDTGPVGGEIRLSSKTKAEVDEILSEISRREVRNTLVAMGAPGWANKKPLPVQPSIDLLYATSPEAAEEYERRYKKAKIYDGDLVMEYWPEVRDRLLSDRGDAFLDDVVTIAKASQ